MEENVLKKNMPSPAGFELADTDRAGVRRPSNKLEYENSMYLNIALKM